MKLQIVDCMRGKPLITAGLLMAAIPADASVTYNFVSAPMAIGMLDNGGSRVRDIPGQQLGVIDPVLLGFPQFASLTFTSPLAAGSTTKLHAELNGFHFIKPTNQGGLETYSVSNFYPYPITSDITPYLALTAGSEISISRYSSLDGQVITNASGDISAWDLKFTTYDDGNGNGFSIDTAANTIDIVPSTINALLHISSNPALPITFTNVVELNGVPTTNDFSFNGADMAFWNNSSNGLYRFYTTQPGSFVPEPETYAMLLAGLGLMGFMARGRINGRSSHRKKAAQQRSKLGHRLALSS